MDKRTRYAINFSDEERVEITSFKRSKVIDRRIYDRLLAIEFLNKGLSLKKAGEMLGKTEQWVAKWRKRFYYKRLKGLEDLPRSGRPLFFSLGR